MELEKTQIRFIWGLGVNDSECDNADGSNPQLFNWMTSASWMGSTPDGLLGEVLRSGNVVSQSGSKPVSPRNANKSSGSSGGAINLMMDDWGGNNMHACPQGRMDCNFLPIWCATQDSDFTV